MPRSIEVPTCNMVHVAYWAVCFDLRFSNSGHQSLPKPPSPSPVLWLSPSSGSSDIDKKLSEKGWGCVGGEAWVQMESMRLCPANVHSAVWMQSGCDGEHSNIGPQCHCILKKIFFIKTDIFCGKKTFLCALRFDVSKKKKSMGTLVEHDSSQHWKLKWACWYYCYCW